MSDELESGTKTFAKREVPIVYIFLCKTVIFIFFNFVCAADNDCQQQKLQMLLLSQQRRRSLYHAGSMTVQRVVCGVRQWRFKPRLHQTHVAVYSTSIPDEQLVSGYKWIRVAVTIVSPIQDVDCDKGYKWIHKVDTTCIRATCVRCKRGITVTPCRSYA